MGVMQFGQMPLCLCGYKIESGVTNDSISCNMLQANVNMSKEIPATCSCHRNL